MIGKNGRNSLLFQVNSPQDLKILSIPSLETLAQEIREEIINTVAKVGGHLGGNLGVVELTLALHKVFNAPEDQLIWDVGHQAYAHKLITGRRDRFHTLRQYQGLAGFTNRKESEYDPFGAGHGSTSLSAAIGFVTARDLQKQSHKVVAIIGDAALGGGMALAALNHIGHAQKDLLMVLNDNKMSISAPVGALSGYLNRIITGHFYNRVRHEYKGLMKSLPTRLGNAGLRVAQLAEEAMKGLYSPGVIFEELGVKYIGPVDGHDIARLIETFERVKDWKGPVLIHVLTVKGKGYDPAESKQIWSHGPGPFDVATGLPMAAGGVTFSQIVADTLVALAKKDPKIVAVTAAMSEGTMLTRFEQAFPDRFYDVGMCEEHAVTFAAGLAASGLKPVAAIYSTFLQRGYDQIIHDVCRQDLPVVFLLDRAGVVGEDGDTHQGLFDFAYLRTVPHMVVGAPSSPEEVVGMMKTAAAHPGPMAIRYPKEKAEIMPDVEAIPPLAVGRGEIVRPGKEVTIVAIGVMVKEALKAAEQLAVEGIDAEVINARWVKPLDMALIVKSASITKRVMTVEDHALQGGFGSAVLEGLADAGLNQVIVHRLGVPDEFIEHGKRQIFLEKFGLTVPGIAKAAKEIMNIQSGSKALPQEYSLPIAR